MHFSSIKNLLRTIVLSLMLATGLAQAADPLPSWNDGPARQAIIDFVARTTTPGSPDFVPVPERIAVFDNDETKVGKKQGAYTIQPFSEMKSTAEKNNVRLAIIAVPADAAQDVANKLVEAGVRGILNFAPCSLSVPEEVALNTVDVAVQLEQLSFQVNVTPGG